MGLQELIHLNHQATILVLLLLDWCFLGARGCPFATRNPGLHAPVWTAALQRPTSPRPRLRLVRIRIRIRGSRMPHMPLCLHSSLPSLHPRGQPLCCCLLQGSSSRVLPCHIRRSVHLLLPRTCCPSHPLSPSISLVLLILVGRLKLRNHRRQRPRNDSDR